MPAISQTIIVRGVPNGGYFVYVSHWAGTECHLVCVRNSVRLRGGGTGGLVVPRVPRRARGRAGPGPAIPGRCGLRRCPSESGGGAGVGRTVRGAAGGRGPAARGRGGAGVGASRGAGTERGGPGAVRRGGGRAAVHR